MLAKKHFMTIVAGSHENSASLCSVFGIFSREGVRKDLMFVIHSESQREGGFQ
jgi:hypothetical protein